MLGFGPQQAIQALYVFTQCEVPLSLRPIVIRDQRPVELSVHDILRHNTKRLVELLRKELQFERKKIDDELEFYKGDVSKAPGSVRRKLDDNAQSVAVQNRFIGDQEDEKRRVNARFDEERSRLRFLWTPEAGGVRK